MSDINKTVILDVKLDTGQSLSDAAKLRDELIALKEAQKANKRETQEQKDLYEAQGASIKSVQERLNLLTQAVKNQETAVKSNNGSFNQLQASLKVGEATLKALTGTMKRNADGTIELTREYFDQKKQVDEAKNALLLFNAGIAQGNLNVGNYDNTLAGMRQKLADLQVVLDNTDVNSEQYAELNKQFQDVSFNAQVAGGKIDSMGEKVAKNKVKDSFNDMQSAAVATTAAIGVLSLAVGTDTKAGENLRKITVALTLAQTALTIARSKDDIVGAAQIIKNKALTASQWLYTTAVGATTGALKVFRTALLTTGIGAVVAGLVLLISKMGLFKSGAEDSAEAQQKLNEQLEKTNAELDKLAESTADVGGRYKRLIALAEAQGASEGELYELRKKALIQQKEAIEVAQGVAASGDEIVKLNERLLDTENDLKILDAEYAKQRIENSKEATEKKKAELERLSDMMDDYYNRLIDEEQKYRDSLDMTAWEYYQNLLKIQEDVKNQSTKIYDDMGEEIVTSTEGTYDDLSDVFKGYIKDKKEDLLQEQADQVEIISNTAEAVGKIFADSLTQTGLDLKKFSKGVITLILDELEKTLLAAQVQILAKELASKSFAGIATAAIQIGLITAAFESVKALINRDSKAEFYEGGYTGDGNPRSESKALGAKDYVYHKDEYVVPSKVLNDPQGAKLVMALESMRVSNPIKIGGIGKADGGFASSMSRVTGLTAQDLSKVKIVTVISEVKDALNKVEISEGVGSL